MLADKFRRGENVQNSKLQPWLSEEENAQIDAEWQEQPELRETLKEITWRIEMLRFTKIVQK